MSATATPSGRPVGRTQGPDRLLALRHGVGGDLALAAEPDQVLHCTLGTGDPDPDTDFDSDFDGSYVRSRRADLDVRPRRSSRSS